VAASFFKFRDLDGVEIDRVPGLAVFLWAGVGWTGGGRMPAPLRSGEPGPGPDGTRQGVLTVRQARAGDGATWQTGISGFGTTTRVIGCRAWLRIGAPFSPIQAGRADRRARRLPDPPGVPVGGRPVPIALRAAPLPARGLTAGQL
jgi:hypothetical protein